MAARHNPLIQALLQAERYPHPVSECRLIETHISWVILTGEYAYKIKKPVDLGFLDFTQLQARRHYCEEELRLNRRLAPQLYLAVIAIGGSSTDPQLYEPGAAADNTPIIEYAVKMRQFPQSQLASELLARGELGAAELNSLAQSLVEFHAGLSPCHAPCNYGNTEQILAPMQENFHLLFKTLPESTRPQLLRLQQWTLTNYHRLYDTLAQRQSKEKIRECHGDAHLGNMVYWKGRILLFDSLEFNPSLRWIDTMSELAFVLMDLEYHRRADLASSFLNSYLEASGDYDGVKLLHFYQVYRALVRAKVAAIRATQHHDAAKNSTSDTHWQRYLDLAKHFTRIHRPTLYIMHGFSGSGKSTIAASLSVLRHTIRLRSDVERKRLHGLAASASSHSALSNGIYQHEATERTYRHLARLTRDLLANAYSVIVDASFLAQGQRRRFQQLAHELNCRFVILDIRAPRMLLQQRLLARVQQGGDASEATLAVLQQQFANHEPLDYDELRTTLIINSNPAPDGESLQRLLLGHQRHHGIHPKARGLTLY